MPNSARSHPRTLPTTRRRADFARATQSEFVPNNPRGSPLEWSIGRNEGDRLKQCLQSVLTAAQVVYVDSGSTDGSVQYAKEFGISVVELDLTRPFTAARARNAGLTEGAER